MSESQWQQQSEVMLNITASLSYPRFSFVPPLSAAMSAVGADSARIQSAEAPTPYCDSRRESVVLSAINADFTNIS